MAIKQRALMKLNTTKNHMVRAMSTGSKAALDRVCQDLTETRELYRKGLSRQGYAAYEEIWDGLVLAVRKMVEDGEEDVREEVYTLCQELLQYLEQETGTETRFKKEIVFLPYKGEMWDSLESIWRAAAGDKEHCNAYVIPIPYADRNPDGSVARWHYEGDRFPEDVPIVDWQQVDLSVLHPDAIFIQNPYDGSNLVTSIDGRYYAENLRTNTDLLIYSPYYVTSGGMGEGARNCPVFPYVDYIIVQSESLRKFFHPSVPLEKLIPLGSPKLDRVIRFCNAPPDPPEAWKEKLKGKTVYFYNTSLGGMLYDTAAFLNKMQYVFRTFAGRKDACLIWRPHPLMAATLSSMRETAVPYYEKLKEMFLKEDIGIYDDTPDIDRTIALSDVYVGDGATSVTMLFAIVGKPMFILDDNIHELPQPEDWRGGTLTEVTFQGQDDWIVTPSNQLYHATGQGDAYLHVCSLCEYHAGSYYLKVVEVGGKDYVCPANAQDILLVSEDGLGERIPLEREVEIPGAFAQAWQAGPYIFLVPLRYPAVVRYDTRTKELAYLKDVNHIFAKNIRGEWRIGGSCVWQGELLIASPDTSEVLRINVGTLETKVENVGAGSGGCCLMAVDGEEVWLLPSAGFTLRRWHPATGEIQEYSAKVEGIQCRHPVHQFACDEFPFGQPAFDEDYVYLPPCWGNKFVRLRRDIGAAGEWGIPLQATSAGKDSYFGRTSVAGFLRETEKGHWRMFYWPERKLYDVEVRTGECREVPVLLDEDALRHEAAGFAEQAEWLRYGCQENAFHTLPALLDGTLPGDLHDKDRQLRAYRQVAANYDGTAGEKIYQFAMQKLEQARKMETVGE